MRGSSLGLALVGIGFVVVGLLIVFTQLLTYLLTVPSATSIGVILIGFGVVVLILAWVFMFQSRSLPMEPSDWS